MVGNNDDDNDITQRHRRSNQNTMQRRRLGRTILCSFVASSIFIFQVSKLHFTFSNVPHDPSESENFDFVLSSGSANEARWNDMVVTLPTVVEDTANKLDLHPRSRHEDAKTEPTTISNMPRSEVFRSSSPQSSSSELRFSQGNTVNATKSSKFDHKKQKSTNLDVSTKYTSKKQTDRTQTVIGDDIARSVPSMPATKSIHNRSNDAKEPSKIHSIIIASNESFFWAGAQRRLCGHIKKEISAITKNDPSGRGEDTRIGLFLRAPCMMIHNRRQHGNFMIGYYGMRVAALAFNASFEFQCAEDYDDDDGDNAKNSRSKSRQSKKQDRVSTSLLQQSYFWWLQTNEYSSSLTGGPPKSRRRGGIHKMNHTVYHPQQPTYKDACGGMGKAALQYSSEYARRDLRNMADDMSAQLASTLDEVAIHWRCGDVLSRKIPKADKNYGLLKFRSYKRRIPDSVRSIGIVTAPFKSGDSRKEDRGFVADCKNIARSLVKYLERNYPYANITIRNDPSETIPQVLSRLILANYTFCARSTFCLFPAIASYGTSFVQQGGVAYFFDRVADAYDNIHIMDEPVMLSHEVVERGIDQTVQWLLSD